MVHGPPWDFLTANIYSNKSKKNVQISPTFSLLAHTDRIIFTVGPPCPSIVDPPLPRQADCTNDAAQALLDRYHVAKKSYIHELQQVPWVPLMPPPNIPSDPPTLSARQEEVRCRLSTPVPLAFIARPVKMCQPMSEISIGISNIQGKRSVSHYFFRGALAIVTLSYRKNSFL